MTVYVAEQGEYEDRGVIGVYATKEAAFALIKTRAPTGWVPMGTPIDMWWNGLEWDRNIVLKPFEVECA